MLRFNHMELTVPRGFVAESGAEILAFFGEILGFLSGEFPGLNQPHLILKTDPEGSQFLFIAEHDAPLEVGGDDHLGLHVDSAADVERALAACLRWRETDPNVEIRDQGVLDLPQTLTRAFYVRYRLPLWFDVQNISYKPGFEPSRVWEYRLGRASHRFRTGETK